MNAAQRSMLFGMAGRVAAARRVKVDEVRGEVTLATFGEPRSWSTFGQPEVDRVKNALQLLIDELNLDALIEANQYRAHDEAQAHHVPAVRPGKNAVRDAARCGWQPRKYASRYERMTDVDDPGERARLVWFIGRLFAPAYVRRVVGDIFQTTDWEALPMSRLKHLKDALKNRLGKWLTAHKEKHAFGFSLAARNPRSRTGMLTNEELIAELLARGICLDLSAATPPVHVEADNCPF